jgi:hypothetical protein
MSRRGQSNIYRWGKDRWFLATGTSNEHGAMSALELFSLLAKSRPGLGSHLRQGAPRESIRRVADVTGTPMPMPLAAMYECHDGLSGEQDLVRGWQYARHEPDENRKDDALGKVAEILDKWLAKNAKDGDSWYDLACTWALRGDKTRALENLARAIKLDNSLREQASSDEDFATLRESPEFLKVVGKRK